MGKTREKRGSCKTRTHDALDSAISKLSLSHEVSERIAKKQDNNKTAQIAHAKKPSKQRSTFAASVRNIKNKLQMDSGKFESRKIDPMAPFEIVPFPERRRNKLLQNEMHEDGRLAPSQQQQQINPQLLEQLAKKSKSKEQEEATTFNAPVSAKFLEQMQQEMDPMDVRTFIPDPPGMFFRSQCMKIYQQATGNKLPTQDPNSLWASETVRATGWGDMWMSNKISCKCMSCELREVLPNAKGVKLVILIDLDNWGFDPLSQPLLDKHVQHWLIKNAKNIYIWCFYQQKVRDYVTNKELFDRLAQNQSISSVPPSLFEVFSKHNHLRFSPCGFHKQATDTAILQTCELLATDRELRISAEKIPGLLLKGFYCTRIETFLDQIEGLFAPKMSISPSK